MGGKNPFMPGFGIKDWKKQQEIAPKNSDNQFLNVTLKQGT